jgi:DNA-binding transcriptional MerR regulator
VTYATRAFAELTSVTVKTLRHYERLGLLSPKRTGSRYRRYSVDDLQRLERVLALKSVGLPLTTIKTLMARGGAGLRAHREALEGKRANLDRAIEALRTIDLDPKPQQALDGFVRDAAWERWESVRMKRASTAPRAPDRAPASKFALFREIAAALDGDREGVDWPALAGRCRGAFDPATFPSAESRARWPAGMRRYVASLYDASPDTFERVAAFVEAQGVK